MSYKYQDKIWIEERKGSGDEIRKQTKLFDTVAIEVLIRPPTSDEEMESKQTHNPEDWFKQEIKTNWANWHKSRKIDTVQMWNKLGHWRLSPRL
jgi:hypothetical protein